MRSFNKFYKYDQAECGGGGGNSSGIFLRMMREFSVGSDSSTKLLYKWHRLCVFAKLTASKEFPVIISWFRFFSLFVNKIISRTQSSCRIRRTHITTDGTRHHFLALFCPNTNWFISNWIHFIPLQIFFSFDFLARARFSAFTSRTDFIYACKIAHSVCLRVCLLNIVVVRSSLFTEHR